MLHGLGHGGAFGALVWITLRPADPTGDWRPARSWLLSGVAPEVATVAASAFWIASMLGFVAAALAFWGLIPLGDGWRTLAIGSAITSLAGIILFLGTWPAFNTIAALAINLAILVTLVWLRWPEAAAAL